MKPFVALGLTAAGIAVFLCLPRESRRHLNAAPRHWIAGCLEHMMANLPEGAPPKLIMSILPRLREQNEQIIALLREQNGILRELQRSVHKENGFGRGIE